MFWNFDFFPVSELVNSVKLKRGLSYIILCYGSCTWFIRRCCGTGLVLLSRDIIPAGRDLEETNRNLDEMADHLVALQSETGITPLWATCNLFSHPRCTFLLRESRNSKPNFYVYLFPIASSASYYLLFLSTVSWLFIHARQILPVTYFSYLSTVYMCCICINHLTPVLIIGWIHCPITYLGIPVYSDHAIAAYFAYFAKMRISHIFPHIMAFSKFRIFISAFRVFIYA